MALAPGTRLGAYEIISLLGAGGMGEVYRARDSRLEREVAIKVLPDAGTASAQTRERFHREARAASALNHPHICTIYEVGTDPPLIAMELLEGETLQERLDRGAIVVPALVDIASAVADALDAAHRKGIVHRDLETQDLDVELPAAVEVLRLDGPARFSSRSSGYSLGQDNRGVDLEVIKAQSDPS